MTPPARRCPSVACLLSLASCLAAAVTATAGGHRVMLLSSDAFRCGAEPGLGCGLAIQPTLAGLDALEGVARSEVSWDGGTFRLRLAPDADEEAVLKEAVATLPGETVAVAAAPEGTTRWVDRRRTVQLSRREARVLARRFGEAMGDAAGLDADDARRLERHLQAELTRAFERAHAGGGGVDRLGPELAGARVAFERRVAAFLSADERARVAAFLDATLAEQPVAGMDCAAPMKPPPRG